MVNVFLTLLLWMLGISASGASFPCALRDLGQEKRVCVCNATYCDTIDRISNINAGEFIAFTSSKDGLRFKKTVGRLRPAIREQLLGAKNSISLTINTSVKYQKIMGFGGALTDSVGINALSLGKNSQENLLRSYFSVQGIEYNMVRLPIGGTDFSTHPYSYDDGAVDPNLEKFSLAKEDLKYKIPLIQRAMNMSEREIHIVAASWSPPPWMKTNNQYSGLGYLKEEYYDLYSKYILRFLDEYKKYNLKVWAISTGNEPSNGLFPFKQLNSLGWTPVSITKWICDFFGPQLRNSVYNNTVMLAFDDQRLFLPWWINSMVRADKSILRYVNGFGVHAYWDLMIGPGVISALQQNYPDKFILYTEYSLGDKPWEIKVDIGSWDRGETYISDIIQNINTWVTGWIDWNLALDMNGGPSWVKNYVDSPILVNSSADEFYKQPMFYAIGHISKFIERDAVRVQTSPTDSNDVHTMSVVNPDGRLIIVMLNKNDSHIEASIEVSEKGRINIDLPSHSFITILC